MKNFDFSVLLYSVLGFGFSMSNIELINFVHELTLFSIYCIQKAEIGGFAALGTIFTLLSLLIIIPVDRIVKRKETISLGVVIYSFALSTPNETLFYIGSGLSVGLVIASVVNKSYEDLVVADLFLAMSLIVVSFYQANWEANFMNMFILFIILSTSKYALVTKLLTRKESDCVNNRTGFLLTLISLTKAWVVK